MLRRAFFSIVFLLLMCSTTVMAQCPLNIGFDLGTFTNWQGLTGTVLPDGSVDLPNLGIVDGQHTLISRASKQVDGYGNFPIASPNGSPYVVKLGNNGTQKGAERLTYTIAIPKNNTDFSLIYYYAVVFQNPGHTAAQQPKFTANVFDVTDNKYADCGSFAFVASGNLPGFQNATGGVVYKTWSPVTINLAGYAGKTIRLEFTTNDCTLGGHFGYAYLDVNQNCTSPVSGNVQCPGATYVNLTAPSGFAQYYWYKGNDFKTPIGNTNTLLVKPAPPTGTQYSVRIVPFPGIGCEDTITTTIQSPENLALVVKPSVQACRLQPVDITAASITAGSDPSFSFTYYTDAAATKFIDDPTSIVDSGTYYIKATSAGGCEYLKPIKLSFLVSPVLTLHDPPAVCAPATVDITAAAITAGSTNAPNITYWTDANATISLSNPNKIAKSGTYYIKSTNSIDCADTKPVTVLVNDLPVLKTVALIGCQKVDITAPEATTYRDNSLTYTYWKNAAATDSLFTPTAVTKNGTYYIKATTAAGCFVIAPISVTVYDYPVTTVTYPPAVIFPATIDISQTFTRQQGTVYYFYIDSAATHLVPDPTKIGIRGTYYIRAINGNDCAVSFPVHVMINPPAVVDYGVNTFTPNGDGMNEIFRPKITKSVKLNHFRIYSSWGALLFETSDYLQGWDGTNNGKKMPVGTYYWIMDGFDTYINKAFTKTGSVTIVL